MTDAEDEEPRFLGPLAQWPRYGAAYRGRRFVIAPVPTDDGRWVLSIDDWTEPHVFHESVVAAIDAALAIIKQMVDQERVTTEGEDGPKEPGGS